MPRSIYFDLTGQRFGDLLVLNRLSDPPRRQVFWECLCVCGNKSVVISANLWNGTTKSCGCKRRLLSSLRSKTHGMTSSPTYRVWSGMKTRCLNSKSTNYNLYGGRGIKICDRWMTFENFLSDMGTRPANMTLDRINVDGNYEPSNCRWASPQEQSKNKRASKLINKDSFEKFLRTQKYLNEETIYLLVKNYFNLN